MRFLIPILLLSITMQAQLDVPALRAKYNRQMVGMGEYQCLFSDPATSLPWGVGNTSNLGMFRLRLDKRRNKRLPH